MSPVVGAVYDAGTGGSPNYNLYVLRQSMNPWNQLNSGRERPERFFILDFGPISRRVPESKWRAMATAEGHRLVSNEAKACRFCGKPLSPNCPCPKTTEHSPGGWT